MSQLLNISLIILNWNGKEDTLECLDSVQKINYPNFSIIVADNGSTDDSVAVIRNAYPDIFILENGDNLGFAEGNNRAITYALDHGADAVVILNNDTIVDASLLQAFNEAYHGLPDAGILGTVSFYYNQPDVIWAAGGEWDSSILELKHLCLDQNEHNLPSSEPFSVNYAVGCALFIHKSVIKKIGMMDPLFFLNFEENDWCQRSIKLGLTNYTIPDAKIWHKVSASFNGESPLWKYYMTRNLLLWAKRHLPHNEYRAVIKKTIFEFIPIITFACNTNSMTFKQRYWAFSNWIKQFKSRFYSPFYLAQFYGILHYFIQSFGACPRKVQTKLSQ